MQLILYYTYHDDTGSEQGDHDGHRVHRQLELQELGDTVVHVAPPDDGFDDTREIVVDENYVGGLLCNISTGDTLK